MPVNTRQRCYDTNSSINNEFTRLVVNNQVITNERAVSPTIRVSVGNCKYRRVLVEDVIEQIDRGRNQIFSPLSIKHRLRSSTHRFM